MGSENPPTAPIDVQRAKSVIALAGDLPDTARVVGVTAGDLRNLDRLICALVIAAAPTLDKEPQ
jgi:hypothetical protein